MGPLLDRNLGRVPVGKLQALAARVKKARLHLDVFNENVTVDPQTGVVTHAMDLCHHCTGQCCASLVIPITKKDRRRLASHLGVKPREVALLPLDGDEDDDTLAGYLSQGDGPCPYFDKGCSVHPGRPDVCRGFGLLACANAGVFQAR